MPTPPPRPPVRKGPLVLLAIALVIFGAWGALRSRDGAGGRSADSPTGVQPGRATQTPPTAVVTSPPSTTPALPAPAAPSRPDAPLEALARSLAAKDAEGARAAAAALRRLLRTDAAARGRAAALLLDPSTPADLRRALALVFGTFDGEENDRALLAVLRQSPADAALARCALLALGGTREPEEEDDVFDLGDRPFGAEGPGGLGITVRREIGAEATRLAMEGFLGAAGEGIREAAARALRHTLAEPDVRVAFLGRLSLESADGVAEVLGEGLAVRAGGTGDPSERREIVGVLLSRAGEEGLDGTRFRMEDDLARVPLEPAERRTLESLASPGRPFGVRSFALTTLAGAAVRGGAGAEAECAAVLSGILGSDPDPAARDLSARLLRRIPSGPAGLATLTKAAREDAAWNVRFTALETLAARGAEPGVAGTLEAALADPDPRVAERAREAARASPRNETGGPAARPTPRRGAPDGPVRGPDARAEP